jgi:hypothetical protein
MKMKQHMSMNSLIIFARVVLQATIYSATHRCLRPLPCRLGECGKRELQRFINILVGSKWRKKISQCVRVDQPWVQRIRCYSLSCKVAFSD